MVSAVVLKVVPSFLVANLILGSVVELTPITKSFIESGEIPILEVDIPPSCDSKISAVSVSSTSFMSASILILAFVVDFICNFSVGVSVPIPVLPLTIKSLVTVKPLTIFIVVSNGVPPLIPILNVLLVSLYV